VARDGGRPAKPYGLEATAARTKDNTECGKAPCRAAAASSNWKSTGACAVLESLYAPRLGSGLVSARFELPAPGWIAERRSWALTPAAAPSASKLETFGI